MCRKQHVNATTFAIYIQILVGGAQKKNKIPRLFGTVCDQNRSNRSQNSSSDDDDDDDDDGAGETVARDGH